LLQYVVAFVNRKPESYKDGTVQVRSIGRRRLKELLHVAVGSPVPHVDPPVVRAGTPQPRPFEPPIQLENPSDEELEKVRQATTGATNIRWEHQLERTSAGVEWRHHAHIQNADAFYWLIVTLLMNADARSTLAQCAQCPEFFVLAKASKGRPQVYHNEDCAKAANAAGADERQRNLRKRRAAIEMLKGSTASKSKVQEAVKLAFHAHPKETAEQLAGRARVILKTPTKRK